MDWFSVSFNLLYAYRLLYTLSTGRLRRCCCLMHSGEGKCCVASSDRRSKTHRPSGSRFQPRYRDDELWKLTYAFLQHDCRGAFLGGEWRGSCGSSTFSSYSRASPRWNYQREHEVDGRAGLHRCHCGNCFLLRVSCRWKSDWQDRIVWKTFSLSRWKEWMALDWFRFRFYETRISHPKKHDREHLQNRMPRTSMSTRILLDGMLGACTN